jgi:hypothetical protein
MLKIKSYKLLEMPSSGKIDWSKKHNWKKWRPENKLKSRIAKRIGRVNRKSTKL